MTDRIVDMDSAKSFASERGWWVEKHEFLHLYGTWEVIQWRRETETDDEESPSALVEVCWVSLPTSRKKGMKHGVYVSDRLKRRGEIKAMSGVGSTAVYWSLEQALELA